MALKISTAKFGLSLAVLGCLMNVIAGVRRLEVFNAVYESFDESYYDILQNIGTASISNTALQLTPDSASSDFLLSNNSGRFMLKQPFRLWDDTEKNRVASFNSSFLINIYRINNDTPGEGIAFLIASNLEMPLNSYGQYLGLSNASIEGNPSNKFIAVELDTRKQEDDPDDNHVGFDFNGAKSSYWEYLTPHGIILAPVGVKFHNVWVQYDGVDKLLKVYIAEQAEITGPTPPMPSLPILSRRVDLREFIGEGAYFGFSASTGNLTQLNAVVPWNMSTEYFTEYLTEEHKSVVPIALGAAGVLSTVITCIFVIYYLQKRRRAKNNFDILGKLKQLPGMPREFKLKELKIATHNFDEKNKLGEGGFGVVYRGSLANENLEVAVKCFSRENIKGRDDFFAELTIINRLRHKHLVRLLGWSHQKGRLLLVYEYMPNGSLDSHIFIGADTEPLNWSLRCKILSEVALAVHYLHNEFDQLVVHRDLKASNIMLDSNFNARLGDFGLARALENEKTSYAEAEGFAGTMGYIAPECFLTGKATQRLEIFALGAVILEVVCGLRPGTRMGGYQSLVDWVWSLRREGRLAEAVDEKLGNNYEAEEAEKFLLLGLMCSHPIATERPKTNAIVQIISGSLPVPHVPPFRPAFTWPAAEPSYIESTSFTTTSSPQNSRYLTDEKYIEHKDHSINISP